MTRAPLIAITTYHRDEKGSVRLPAAYADAVRRAGGIPILVPPGEGRVEQLLDRIDGFVLSGGGDIDPALYCASANEDVYWVDEERDRSEISLLESALERRLPLFCICRGFQLLNVLLGGSLIVHIPASVPDAIAHRQPPEKPYGPIHHAVTLAPDSRLAEVVGVGQICGAASWHHQGLDRLATNLRPVAWAEDGIVEAAEMSDRPNLLAVQWHPELTAGTDPVQQRLFDALIEWSR